MKSLVKGVIGVLNLDGRQINMTVIALIVLGDSRSSRGLTGGVLEAPHSGEMSTEFFTPLISTSVSHGLSLPQC